MSDNRPRTNLEVQPKPERWRFSAEYKGRMVVEAEQCQHGESEVIHQHGQQVMSAAFAAYPERFRNGMPRVKGVPTAVYINPSKPPQNLP